MPSKNIFLYYVPFTCAYSYAKTLKNHRPADFFPFLFSRLAFNLLFITYWCVMFLKYNYSSGHFKNLFPSGMPFDMLIYLWSNVLMERGVNRRKEQQQVLIY